MGLIFDPFVFAHCDAASSTRLQSSSFSPPNHHPTPFHMKYLFSSTLLCAILLLLSSAISAQTIERSVISAYGTSATAGNISVDMTVGEVAVTTAQAGSILVTQGFHQPTDGSVSIDKGLGVQVDYKLYPNPSTDFLTLELRAASQTTVFVNVIDARGRLTSLESKTLQLGPSTVETQWNTQLLSEGMYLIVVKNESGQIAGSFRFQKQ